MGIPVPQCLAFHDKDQCEDTAGCIKRKHGDLLWGDRLKHLNANLVAEFVPLLRSADQSR